MKRFSLNIGVFLIGLIIFNYFLYIKVFEIYLEPYLTFDNPKGLKTFLLADSHGQALGEDLSSIGVVNFSANSDSYLDMERKMMYLINSQEVERIIISADGHTLSKYRNRLNNQDRSILLRNISDNDPILKGEFKLFWEKKVKRYIVPLNKKSSSVVRSYVESLFTKKNLFKKNIFKKRGSRKKKSPPKKIKQFDATKMDLKMEQRSLKQYGPSKSDQLIASLERMIAICEERNIVLIGFQFPITKEYYEIVKEQDYGAKKLMESKGIVVLDFIEIFSGHNEFFKDQDHLNVNGSLELVRLIRERGKLD